MLFLSGQTISSVGTQISQLAFPLFILALTGSPAQAGIAGTLRVLPYLLLSLPAGALVDRWDRKRVMILCDTGRALSLGSVPLAFASGHLTLVQLYLVSLIEGTLFVFFNLAQVACLPRVVPKEQLPAAIGQNVAADSCAFLLGPALGGALYSFGRIVPFLTDALSYLASVISLFFINTRLQEERAAPPRKLWLEIREGLSWLWHQPLLCFLALSGLLIQLLGGAGIVLIVIVLAQQQHASSVAIGLILAMDGTGSILGALMANRFQKWFNFKQLMVGSQWLWALLLLLFALAPNLLALAGLLALLYIVGTLFDVVQFSYRLGLIPDELQGRVNSVYRLFAFSGAPLGLTLTGVLLQAFGPILTILLFGAGLLILAMVTTLNPYVRHARSLVEA